MLIIPWYRGLRLGHPNDLDGAVIEKRGSVIRKSETDFGWAKTTDTYSDHLVLILPVLPQPYPDLAPALYLVCQVTSPGSSCWPWSPSFSPFCCLDSETIYQNSDCPSTVKNSYLKIGNVTLVFSGGYSTWWEKWPFLEFFLLYIPK